MHWCTFEQTKAVHDAFANASWTGMAELQRLSQRYEHCTLELEAAPQWGKLAPEDRATILRDEADLDAWLVETRQLMASKLMQGPIQFQ